MDLQVARRNMILQQLRTCNVLDEQVLAHMQAVPREEFVPSQYRAAAYSDMVIPLADDAAMMTPVEEGTILQALAIQPHETVLEIGTGSGYFSALLAKMAASVITIDRKVERIERAQALWQNLGLSNISAIQADGARGYLEKAPYDVIVFTASTSEVPNIVKPQLLPGGRLFVIVGQAQNMHAMLLTRNGDDWTQEVLFETHVLPLITHSNKDPFKF